MIIKSVRVVKDIEILYIKSSEDFREHIITMLSTEIAKKVRDTIPVIAERSEYGGQSEYSMEVFVVSHEEMVRRINAVRSEFGDQCEAAIKMLTTGEWPKK